MKAYSKQLKPRHGYIRQIVDAGDGLIILETVHNYPPKTSNLYKVGYDFHPIWDAEIRMCGLNTDYYSNYVYQDDDGMLSCAAQFGTYSIDPKTGKIMREAYTK